MPRIHPWNQRKMVESKPFFDYYDMRCAKDSTTSVAKRMRTNPGRIERFRKNEKMDLYTIDEWLTYDRVTSIHELYPDD